MPKINYSAVVVAAVAAFLFSALYYSPLLLGNVLGAVDPVYRGGLKPSIATILVEIVRTLGITYVLARLIALTGRDGWKDAVRFALWAWFGFSFLMWVGAIIWEKQPWQVAAIHCGDWLVKTVLTAFILGLWTTRRSDLGPNDPKH
ncbi:MAG: DUF1761 domain-containing protein [Acidobacteriota bacterium]|nr:DUF1761 domain-containing protein [Acidobacteriota bacterium]